MFKICVEWIIFEKSIITWSMVCCFTSSKGHGITPAICYLWRPSATTIAVYFLNKGDLLRTPMDRNKKIFKILKLDVQKTSTDVKIMTDVESFFALWQALKYRSIFRRPLSPVFLSSHDRVKPHADRKKLLKNGPPEVM